MKRLPMVFAAILFISMMCGCGSSGSSTEIIESSSGFSTEVVEEKTTTIAPTEKQTGEPVTTAEPTTENSIDQSAVNQREAYQKLQEDFAVFISSVFGDDYIDYLSDEMPLVVFDGDDGTYSFTFNAKNRGCFPLVCLYAAATPIYCQQNNHALDMVSVWYTSDSFDKDGLSWTSYDGEKGLFCDMSVDDYNIAFLSDIAYDDVKTIIELGTGINKFEEYYAASEKSQEEGGNNSAVPREYQNALATAQRYSDGQHMSKDRLYKQLTSEYGEAFDEDAAKYAVEHVDADYKKNALLTAKSYSDGQFMSKKRIYKQLTSEYGEMFTEEEAQYAVDNLEADYNYNALMTAISYRDGQNMSKSKIKKQLVSDYGEMFTEEEAQFAIDHLDD